LYSYSVKGLSGCELLPYFSLSLYLSLFLSTRSVVHSWTRQGFRPDLSVAARKKKRTNYEIFNSPRRTMFGSGFVSFPA
jgi:hypothetical protein